MLFYWLAESSHQKYFKELQGYYLIKGRKEYNLRNNSHKNYIYQF